MKYLIAVLFLVSAAPALAQENDWRYDASIYLWLPSTTVIAETPIGTAEGELSGSDALSDLKFAFMGTFEARKGRWGFLGDLIYLNVAPDAPTPKGLAYSSVTVDSKLTMFSVYALYRPYETEQVSLDFGVGLRGYSANLTTTFTGAALQTQSFDSGEDWVDPLLAARFRVNFNDKWYGALFLDGGGFSGSDSTYQVVATVGYRFNEHWGVQGGYRYLNIDKSTNGPTDFSFELSGPIIGAVYRF